MTQTPPPSDPSQWNEHMKQSAHEIWQAGLGAFAKAQQEGSKAFDNLVKEGSKWQEATLAAQAKMTEAAAKAGHMASDLAQDMGQRASGQLDRLESIFEERVAKAMQHMGLPSAQELTDLKARVEKLETELASLKAKAGNPNQG
jgi:poly(hydroxyalkanoate) granule-associated protein